MKEKVFQMNDCDWWCDYSAEEAKNNYNKFTGFDDEDYYKDRPPQELTEEEMNRYKYTKEDGKTITFKEELENRIKNNAVPSFFASTEY